MNKGAVFSGSFYEEEILRMASQIIEGRAMSPSENAKACLETTKRVCYFRMRLNEREVFSVMFLDSQKRMIDFQDMFFGTIGKVAVYPREIVREALKLNASYIVLAHNHPSGDTTPSAYDIAVTKKIVEACALFDIGVVDHLIVGNSVFSFVENGVEI